VPIQQFVILSPAEHQGEGLPPLGSRSEIIDLVRPFNTAPENDQGDVLFGPGIRIEMPPDEPITQMLLTLTEEEIAWQVIMRLTKSLQWKLLDPVTGRELNP